MTSFYVDSNGGEVDYTTAAQAAQLAAEVAQAGAEAAEVGAQAAETGASGYATAALAAQIAAELAETNAQTAQAAAELAETNAETAETSALAAQAAAELAAAAIPAFPGDAAGVLTNDGAGVLTWEASAGFDPYGDYTPFGTWHFGTVASGESFTIAGGVLGDDTDADFGIYNHDSYVATAGHRFQQQVRSIDASKVSIKGIINDSLDQSILIENYCNQAGAGFGISSLMLESDGSTLTQAILGSSSGVDKTAYITVYAEGGVSSRISITADDIISHTADSHQVHVPVGGYNLVTDDFSFAAPTYLFGTINKHASFGSTPLMFLASPYLNENVGISTSWDSTTGIGSTAINASFASCGVGYDSATGYTSAQLYINTGSISSGLYLTQGATTITADLSSSDGNITITATGTAVASDVIISASNGKVTINSTKQLELKPSGTTTSYVDISTALALKVRRYANLSAITTAITVPLTGMLVMVTGQGLAVYTGSAWKKASDDSTSIT